MKEEDKEGYIHHIFNNGLNAGIINRDSLYVFDKVLKFIDDNKFHDDLDDIENIINILDEYYITKRKFNNVEKEFNKIKKKINKYFPKKD